MRFRGVEGVEEARRIRIGEADAVVAHAERRRERSIEQPPVPADLENVRALAHGSHRVHAIHDQVQQDLLELHAIARDEG